MLELGPESANLHRQAGARGRRAGARLHRSRAGPRRGNRERRHRRGHARVAGALLRRFFRRRGVSCGFREAGRPAAGERIARSEDGAHRRGAAGEISAGRGSVAGAGADDQTEMLYYLVYHVSAAPGAPAQRLSLYHRAHGARQPLVSFSGADPGTLDDPAPAAIADWPVHSRRRAQLAPEESRHADDGRHSDRDGHARAHFVLGRSLQCLRAARDLRHAGFRRHRFCRRLTTKWCAATIWASPAGPRSSSRSW